MHATLITRPAFRKAFTLVELLVVIVIIGVLASVVMSKYSQVRENGWSSQCKSHLRNLYQAVVNYSTDTKNPYAYRNGFAGDWIYPRAEQNYPANPNVSTTNNAWVATANGQWWGAPGQANIMSGSLWNYTGQDINSYCCPKFRYLAPAGHSDVVRSYVMNAFFGCQATNSGGVAGSTLQQNNIEASRLLLFADMNPSQYYGNNATYPICNSWAGGGNDDAKLLATSPVGTPPVNTGESIGYIHAMSGGYFGHVVFADGHVEAVGLVQSDGSLRNRTYDACNGQY